MERDDAAAVNRAVKDGLSGSVHYAQLLRRGNLGKELALYRLESESLVSLCRGHGCGALEVRHEADVAVNELGRYCVLAIGELRCLNRNSSHWRFSHTVA